MIPLDWLGDVGEWVEYLPFKYLAYVPAAIVLGKDGYVLGQGLEGQLLIEATWIVGLLVLNRIAFARGVRRYGAFGG
jgi:ABC-2 type transport system permease protein